VAASPQLSLFLREPTRALVPEADHFATERATWAGEKLVGDRVSVTGHKAKPPISYNVRKFAVLVRILLPRLVVDTADARECRL